MNLDEILRELGIRRREMSRRAGLPYGTFANLLRHRTTRVDFGTLNRICTALTPHVKPGPIPFLLWTPGTQPPSQRRSRRQEEPHPEDCCCYDCLYPKEPRIFMPESHRMLGGDDD